MSIDLGNFSIAQWFAEREQHRCGYCKNPSGSISYGMMADELTVEDYKDLIDRGWRRSGKYCYKPTMDKTCCPQYTIRCDATQFALSKSHKKIIKKLNKFLNDGILNKNMPPEGHSEDSIHEFAGYNKPSINLNCTVTTAEGSSCKVNYIQSDMSSGEPALKSVPPKSKDFDSKPIRQNEDTAAENVNTPNDNKKALKGGSGPDPNKPPCKKAKLLRLERKKEKCMQKNIDIQHTGKPATNVPKNLNQFLEEIPFTTKHKFKLKLIPSNKHGIEWEESRDVEYELYKKYQTIVHNDPLEKLSVRNFERFLVTSPLKIILERMDENHRSFRVSANLFKKYQMVVHNDPAEECGASEFYNFLVSTPLKPRPFPEGIEGPGYGSFHQQYWVDEKLIAVGVVDILPGCVSSVYLFYDPDYRDLTLGTYGSLREIQLVQNLAVKIPDLRYYYMGFYIHSCQKMRYKGKLHPSYLLCPETYVWHPIESCLPKLDASKYSRLNEDIDAIDTNSSDSSDVNRIKIIYNFKLMYVQDYVSIFKGKREIFDHLATLIGKKSSRNIIFVID